MPRTCSKCQQPRGQWDEKCGSCGQDFAEAPPTAAAAPAACPACGAAAAQGAEACGGCGIYFAKWTQTQEKKKVIQPESAMAETPERLSGWKGGERSHSAIMGLILVLGILGSLPWGVVGLMQVPQSEDPGGTLLRAVCFLATGVCMIGVFLWKKWGLYGLLLSWTLLILDHMSSEAGMWGLFFSLLPVAYVARYGMRELHKFE